MGFTYVSGNTQTEYFYRKNLQGDVIGIVDSTGANVAEYRYDAWGRILEEIGTMASVNPIRYRGYCYDAETEMYYLHTRYYDPEVGRFINSDDVSLLGTNGDFASYNLFDYCGNNSASRVDDGGDCWNIIIGAVVGAAIGAVVSAATQLVEDPNSWKSSAFWGHVAVSAGAGAITGAVAATGVGLAGQIAVNATVGAVSGLADTAIDADDNTEPMDYLVSALLGGTIGAIAGYLGGPGTASKHMQSAFKTALHNGNWRYFYTQTAKEAIRAGESATSGILRGTIPTISRFAIKYLWSEMLVE